MRHLYSALLYVLVPLVLLRLCLRSLRAPAYRRRVAERFGCFRAPPAAAQGPIWVHAVSVGELQAALPLLAALLEKHAGQPLVVTTTTPTASALVRSRLGEEVFHVYLPWDLPGPVRRFLRRVRPRLLVLLETELWPNLLWHCRAAGCRVLLANARLSPASARRYARFGSLTRNTLACLDQVACQSAGDGERFLALGLAPEKLAVTGSLKFDACIDDALRARAAALAQALGTGSRPLVVAASTHPGEEEGVLDALAYLRQQGADCLAVMAPRHPERAAQVAALCRRRGWRPVLRSAGAAPCTGGDLLVLDTIGELPALYGLATVAFVGGSLVAAGGHNTVEPAAWGVPVLCGPHTGNFAAINLLLLRAGALIVVGSPPELGMRLAELLADPARRAAMGAAGREMVRSQRGASDDLLRAISGLARQT